MSEATMKPPDRCRSCRAPMIWALSPNDAKLPLDAEPVTEADPRITLRVVLYQAASIVIYDDQGVEPGTMRLRSLGIGPDAWAERNPGLAVYVSHFATCPNAASFSRGKRP